MERAYEWYTSGPRQRLQPGGAIVVVMTRWNMKDSNRDVIKISKRIKIRSMGDIEFPAILPSNKPVWPEYWKLEELESVKASSDPLVNGMHSGCKTQLQKKDL